MIVIDFPYRFNLTNQSACTLSNVSGGISSSPGGCVVQNNRISLTNALASNFTKGSNTPLSFTFSLGGANPSTMYDAGYFYVSTFAVVNGGSYEIDKGVF